MWAQERVGRARNDIREFSDEVAAAKRELDHLDQDVAGAHHDKHARSCGHFSAPES